MRDSTRSPHTQREKEATSLIPVPLLLDEVEICTKSMVRGNGLALVEGLDPSESC